MGAKGVFDEADEIYRIVGAAMEVHRELRAVLLNFGPKSLQYKRFVLDPREKSSVISLP